MEKLIQHQGEVLEAIKQVETNFGKDSASRKTREYIENRLDKLDRYWAEFQSTNDKLLAYRDSDHSYFFDNQFEKTRRYFESVRQKISSYVPSVDTARNKSPGPSRPTQSRTISPEPPTASARSSRQADEAAADLLTRQRTNFRALKRLIRSIKVDDINVKWELEDELRNIQLRWNAIDTLHLQIDNILQGSDTAYEDEFCYYEDTYKALKRALNQKLASTTHLQQSTPQIEVPIFTGKYVNWPTFYDLFSESIHNNNILTKCQKMQHLKGKLRGEAERLVQHLHISAENYDTAWELLVHRYNNPQLLFTKHIEVLLNQSAVTKQAANEIKRLYDTTMESIYAIQNLGVDTSSWDPILVHLITKKLDYQTYSDYKEARKSPRELPTLTELMSFLESKFTALEPINTRERESVSKSNRQPYYNSKGFHSSKPYYKNQHNFNTEKMPKREYKATATAYNNNWSCPFCKKSHVLYKCNKFLNMKPTEQLKLVTKLQVCVNCLYKHYDNNCNSNKTCNICQNSHNTILHDAISANTESLTSAPPVTVFQSRESTSTKSQVCHTTPVDKQHSVNHVAADDEEILLTTLSVKVRAADGTYATLRALLDQGSQISLISENAVQLLGLARTKYHASVSGIGNGTKPSKGLVTLDITSMYDDYNFSTQALIIPKVVNNLPNITFNKQPWVHLQHIQLADPEYNVSRSIDLLLDASVYSDIIMSGLIKGPNRAPIAQQTKMGWILSGNVRTFNCHVVLNNLSELSQYWEMEEITASKISLTPEDDYCEELYKSTTRRLECGSYEVAIPMKQNFEQQLGLSKTKAIAQFHNLENKMNKNSTFAESYTQFMEEYLNLGHMKPVNDYIKTSCYLPHHGVLKADSTTTKLRTVFNASSKTSSGYSLNDLMGQGPNLQKDLQGLILQWRQHKYVITADIEKMFRTIKVREADQHLQCIVWRPRKTSQATNEKQEPIGEYQLTTVTYGTKAAPYLAMRTLQQIATDCIREHKYLLAAEAIQSSFYMDDLMAGGETLTTTKALQQEITSALKEAGMNIRKWSSNSKEILDGLPADSLDSSLNFKSLESRKTLGLSWNSETDTFSFQNKLKEIEFNDKVTKRLLLSYISKIFDPLGWISPFTIRAKLLFQKTWSDSNTAWDDEISDDLKAAWNQLKLDFQYLNKFIIPRYIGNKNNSQLHGFCDASEKAYACSIYLVSINNKGEYISTLIAAKTKLAPVKNKLTLPKLELCGALLLSRLMAKILETLNCNNIDFHAWTDSMVVLGWLHGDTKRWKQFVSNRVMSILSTIPASKWHHVSSEDNAADCATRGLNASQLLCHTLWWEGPEWIRNFDKTSNKNKIYVAPNLETRTNKHVHTALLDKNNNLIIKLLNDCNSIRRVATTIGWLSRFIQWLANKNDTSRQTYLSSNEMSHSYNLIIKTVQEVEFHDTLTQLKQKSVLKKSNHLLCLNPYIDSQDGLLKVGGRLNNSHLSMSTKHPIILPSHSRLTDLIIQQAHINTLHGGPNLTLSHLREKFWIISGLRTVKREVRKCVKCMRHNDYSKSQIMADLPEPRVTPSRPFTHTGVDFTGHFDIKLNKGRGVKTNKGYVAVFVCLSTKAIHLELVADLSTPSFLAAFRRFCARRGTPSHVYSDNGTNFVGANRLLRKEYEMILETINSDFFNDIKEYNIQWKFNAPAYPSAGGLWEAAVKRLKFHLRRVIGEQKLTYEEFTTLLHQVEACLNSRPLIALTENPDDIYLSPGHFLIGDGLLSRPQTDPQHVSLSTRWHMIQSMNKEIWKKWSSDYLQHLQVRSKWRTPTKNIENGDIVLIKEENLPPGKWALGKVIEVHPGKDGYIRVASVKTKNGIIKRPALKLSVLPVEEPNSNKSLKGDVLSSNDTNSVTHNVPKRGYNSRKVFNSYWVTLLLFFLTTISFGKASFNTSYFSSNQSLYFDKKYDMRLIRDEWTIVAFYNMTTYWTGLRNIEQFVSHLENYLHISKELPLQYKSILYQLGHEISEIDHYNNILEGQISIRQKRGLINGVGNLANSLFGILDDSFAKQYEKDIEKISMNENHLKKLLINQTSVLEAQYNIMKRNEGIMNKQFNIIAKQLREVTNNVNYVQQQQRIELYIMSSSLSANIIISSLRRIQDSLINTITDLTHGHMDIHLLPPDQLLEQINIISGHLQGDIGLPTENGNIEEIYKLMKVNSKFSGKYLIIEIKIPLISKESMEVDRVIGLHQQNYITQFITPYIAFNLQKNLLYILTETDLQACMQSSLNRILCATNKPIYDTSITHDICKITMNNDTPLCTTEVSVCQERWVKLHDTDKWLFTCCEKCSVRIFCPDGVHVESLTDNGILTISQGCIIKSKGYSIYSHNNFLSHTKVQNDLPMIPETSILNRIVNTTYSYVPEDHKGIWQDLKSQIDELQEQANAPMSVHDVHQYAVLYSILAIILVTAAVILTIRWRKLKTARQAAARVVFQANSDRVGADSQPAGVSSVNSVVKIPIRNEEKGTWITPKVIPRSRSVKLDIPSVSDSDCELK